MIRVPLIPRSALFGNPSQFQARLSPDGEWVDLARTIRGRAQRLARTG
jgi:hypothetical protein